VDGLITVLVPDAIISERANAAIIALERIEIGIRGAQKHFAGKAL
jgi:hypothetical protein